MNRTCANNGCGQRAAARVLHPLMPDTAQQLGFIIVRPPGGTPVHFGDFLCLDCAHSAVDNMLMNALAPGPGPAVEQREDGAA